MTSQQLQERPIEELKAGSDFVDSLMPRCDRVVAGAPLWHGWAIMDAFLAGVDYRQRQLAERDALIAGAVATLQQIRDDEWELGGASCAAIATAELAKLKAAQEVNK